MTSSAIPDGSVGSPLPRRAVRLLVLDAQGELLLLRGFDPAQPDIRFWFTIGGGLDDGESVTDGAVRELREETGIQIAPEELEGPVWHQVADIPFNGRWYRQEQDFFTVRVPSRQVSFAGQDPEEQATIDAYRWWSVPDLLATEERYYPAELPTLLSGVLLSMGLSPIDESAS
jgi:8-oxo-dGTP pyrophosphatase MutT (NUDIX family)